MQDLLSPKQVAQALNVSESSVKRWCDKGSIATIYTEGGHRRIRLSDLAGFVRSKSIPIFDFSPIGFQSLGQTARNLESAKKQLAESLMRGDERASSEIVMELYFAKFDIRQICDQVIAQAFHEIGDLWACGRVEIYQERRSCRIAQRILGRLHGLLAEPPASSPLALGCTAEGDNYTIGSTMAELVLREAGWRANALGEDLPLRSLAAAIADHGPAMVWVSCSHISDEQSFVASYRSVYDAFHRDVDFVLGGRALGSSVLEQLPYTVYCRSMTELHDYASKRLGTVSA
jgi:excisionase family DNA binding protein